VPGELRDALRAVLRGGLLVLGAVAVVLIGVFYWPWPYTALAVSLILLAAVIVPLERRSSEKDQ
jgi:Tfp pilus assembly protein PilN